MTAFPSPRRYLLLLLVAGCAFGLGRLSAPPPPPAAPIDLFRPITLRRLDLPNVEVLDLDPYAVRWADRSIRFRLPDADSQRWVVTFTLDDGRRVQLACEQTDRRRAP